MQDSPFPVRGVIEGFYGPFYTSLERNDLIQFIGAHGYNLYIYGPKNDRQHRGRWWEHYPSSIMDQFAETVSTAADAGVTFCYAISPLEYDPSKDFNRLTAKLRSFYDRGVRSFSILVDDISCVLHGNPVCEICPRDAEPHVDVCNRLYEWLQSLDTTCTLSMCPAEYHGVGPFSAYVHALGERLHPAIDIFYSGPDVCSAEIGPEEVGKFSKALGRAPLLWDNYPVNDLAMRPYMHIGPLRGRDAKLYESVRGIVVNPMLQAEASKIPLLTIADYFRDPHNYHPWRSWERALLTIGGRQPYSALLRFAENSLYSSLYTTHASKIERLTNSVLAALKRGEQVSSSSDLQALSDYVDSLDEACYVLKNRMPNTRLRENLLPWIEALEEWAWVGKRSIGLIKRLETGKRYEQNAWNLARAIDEVKDQTKKTAGIALLPLARCALDLVDQRKQQQAARAVTLPPPALSSAA